MTRPFLSAKGMACKTRIYSDQLFLPAYSGNCQGSVVSRWGEIGGAALELRCSFSCQCTSTVTWYKLIGETWSLLKEDDRLDVPVHNASVGGLYQCRCGSCESCFRIGGEEGRG